MTLRSQQAGMTLMKIRHSEHSTTKSSPARGFPPARLTYNFVECSECIIFIVFMLYFAETGMWVDTSTNFFPVAAFRNGV